MKPIEIVMASAEPKPDFNRRRRAGGEAPRTTSPSAIVALRTLATDGV
jgi:hypothetical protein